jgi:site-specific recombinase XerD
MRNANSFGIQFILRMNKVKDGKAPVYARITVNKSRCEISLRKIISPGDWNQARGLAKPKTNDLKLLNSYLEEVRGQLTECYRQLCLQKQLLNAELVKNLWLGHEKKEHSLCALMDYHNVQMKEVLTHGTLKNYYTTARYVKLFLNKHHQTTDIYLSQLNYQFITEFEMFLRKHQPQDHQKGMQNNGVMKHLERLHKMVRLALKLEWISKDPFANFRLRFQKVERDYLTAEELQAVEDKSFSISRLEWVRDLFIFSCYTGLAYTDVMQLTPLNVIVGIDGKYWIKTFRQKTDVAVNVPLLPKAIEILNRYKDMPKAVSNGTLFPVISNQKLNSYLKEIADVCGITKNLTFHLARHTFATTVTLSNGVPIETVSKMLGHAKITTTQIYARVIEKKIGEDMSILENKLLIKSVM